MNPADRGQAPNILPAPIDSGGLESRDGGTYSESVPARPEVSGTQPAVPPASMPTADPVNLPSSSPTSPSLPADNSQSGGSSRDDLKIHYDKEVRKAIGQYATDPYLETKKIEEIKRSYLKDVYNRNVILPTEPI